jgi:hypothetical protein
VRGNGEVVQNRFEGTPLNRPALHDVERKDLDIARGDLQDLVTYRPLARVTWHGEGERRQFERRSTRQNTAHARPVRLDLLEACAHFHGIRVVCFTSDNRLGLPIVLDIKLSSFRRCTVSYVLRSRANVQSLIRPRT